MDYNRLWRIGESIRNRDRLSADDKRFVRTIVPAELEGFPEVKLPTQASHPAGFTLTGGPLRTLLSAVLLLSAQRVLGPRYGTHSSFYDRVERHLAFEIMRSHFHRGFPKGTHCCPPCTLAVYTVLQARAIRYFDCRELAGPVRELIELRQWRFATYSNPRMAGWALR